MPPIVDEAVVLRVWEFSETSQTTLLLTRAHGPVRALAKGSRRPRSLYSGGLDAVTRGEATLFLKTTNALATLAEWSLLEVFAAARSDLRAHAASVYFCDIASRLLPEHDPHPMLYDSLVASLRALDDPARAAEAACGFLWAALAETGHRPELTRDVRTGATLPEAPTHFFSPDQGGLTPDNTPDDATPSVQGWRVRAITIAALRAHVEKHEPFPDARAAARAAGLLCRYTAHILGAEPPTQGLFLRCALGATLTEIGGSALSGT